MNRAEAPDVVIDRLSLRVTGMDALDARTLAQRVAAGLAPALAIGPGEAVLARLAIELEAREGERPEELAARAVSHLAPLINRVVATGARR